MSTAVVYDHLRTTLYVSLVVVLYWKMYTEVGGEWPLATTLPPLAAGGGEAPQRKTTASGAGGRWVHVPT